MGRVVQGSDLTDEQVKAYFDRVIRLDWTTLGPVPQWVAETANAFAAKLPRPTPDEFRLHVDHAVAVAVGWDHPDDLSIMLSTAAKSYYLLAWLEHLQTHGKGSKHLDISLALRVNFTPVMHSPLAD